jgi:hypothetical protein
MRALFLGLLGISLVSAACAAAPSADDSAPLRILLTNDDGVDAPGIKTLRAVLLEAGHDVTVVAPVPGTQRRRNKGCASCACGTQRRREH